MSTRRGFLGLLLGGAVAPFVPVEPASGGVVPGGMVLGRMGEKPSEQTITIERLREAMKLLDHDAEEPRYLVLPPRHINCRSTLKVTQLMFPNVAIIPNKPLRFT